MKKTKDSMGGGLGGGMQMPLMITQGPSGGGPIAHPGVTAMNGYAYQGGY